MDRPARSALASLNALLLTWHLPQLDAWVRPRDGLDPYGYVIWRALRKRNVLADHDRQLSLEPFRCNANELRYWDRGGTLHVKTHTDSVREFITRWEAGAYPTLAAA